MKMNVFEKLFFSLVASIIINFILGCILTLSVFLLMFGISTAGLSGLNKVDIVGMVIIFFAFLVPWSIYNIYRYHIWEKNQKSKAGYMCTLIIPSFFFVFIAIIVNMNKGYIIAASTIKVPRLFSPRISPPWLNILWCTVSTDETAKFIQYLTDYIL